MREKVIKMRRKLTIDEEEELIRVTSKMPVTSGLDKALSISIESVEIKENYLNIEYPKDNKWGEKKQDNCKQVVINEEKRVSGSLFTRNK